MWTPPNLLKIKRHIWHNYQPSSPIPRPPTQLIPIITFYDRHHSRLNRAWKSLIKSNPIFLPTHTISTFRKYKSLRNHLIHGRFSTPTLIISWMHLSWPLTDTVPLHPTCLQPQPIPYSPEDFPVSNISARARRRSYNTYLHHTKMKVFVWSQAVNHVHRKQKKWSYLGNNAR